MPKARQTRDVETKLRTLMMTVQATQEFESHRLHPWHIIVELIDRPLFNLLRYPFGWASTEDIEDMAMEVMLHCYRSRHTYDPARPALTWFFAIARNVKRDWIKKNKKVRVRDNGQSEPTAPPTAHGITLDKLTAQEALAKLPKNEARLLWLFHGEGYTETELSVILQAPVSTIKSRLRRAKKHALACAKER
jgi:RNA polymerase sigma-70 factor (ECF subfamily)